MILIIIVLVPAGWMEANEVKLEYGWAWSLVLAHLFLIALYFVLNRGVEVVLDPPKKKGL